MLKLICSFSRKKTHNGSVFRRSEDVARSREWGFIIGPRSDHSLPLSVTDWLTDDLVEDWMNWPKYADYRDFADHADYAEYAEYAEFAEYAEYAEFVEYA